MISAGVIGLGKMGISHYSILNTHSDVEVVGVCDTSSFVVGCMSKISSARFFNSYEKMLEACDLDCVVIATPTALHKKIVRACLEEGLHVFVEKPFCLHVEEGKEMVNAAKARRIVNQVGYHNKFIATFHKVRSFLEAGLIGDIYHIHGEAYGPVVLRSKGRTWRAQKSEGGGCLHDYASHVINLMNYYVGLPAEVRGTVLQRIFSREVEDAVFSNFFYSNGLTGRLSVNWSEETYRKMSTMITLYGKRGKVIVDRLECKVYLKERNDQFNLDAGWNVLYTTDLTQPVWFYLRGEEYSAQIDYFIQRVKSRRISGNVNSFESALQTDMVIDMLVNDAN